MGNSLDPRMRQALSTGLRAHRDSLHKEASFVKNVVQIGSRIRHPIKGMKAGWAHMSPQKLLASGSEAGGELASTVGRRIRQVKAGEQAKITGIRDAAPALWAKARGAWAKNLGAGAHLTGNVQSKGLKGVAERLSRSGWTGEGRMTKYIPVGGKGMTATWGGMAVPGMYRAATGDTSQGGFLQHAGEGLGWGAGGALTAGLGLPGAIAGVAAGLGGAYLGGKADKAILGDRSQRAQQLSAQVGRQMAQRGQPQQRTQYPQDPEAYYRAAGYPQQGQG